MQNSAYSEMMVHVPMCTHKEPKSVLVVGEDSSSFFNEIKRHGEVEISNVALSVDELSKTPDATFDIVIIDSEYSDLLSPILYAHINRALTENGVFVVSSESQWRDMVPHKLLLKELGAHFKIVMPYSFGIGAKTAQFIVLASKFYHPTADIILQRADMLESLNYYNSDVHIASFAMPNFVRKALLGIAKN